MVFFKFFVALALGAIIGLEREVEIQQKKLYAYGGIRTFLLIAMFGALVGYVSNVLVGYDLFVIVSFVAFVVLVVVGYVIVSGKSKKMGATTEFAAIITFLVAIFIMKGFVIIGVIAAILTAAILAFKPQLHLLAKSVEREEMYATIKFGIITLVVLPLLPNNNYSLVDFPVLADVINSFPNVAAVLSEISVFNPYHIWLMVVFITGISLVGYILIKIVGAERGLGLTGFLGGLVSSTAVTSSLTHESKSVKNLKKLVNPLVFGVVIASSTMFLRVLFEVLVLNKSLLKWLIYPIGVMALGGFGVAGYLYFTRDKELKKDFDFQSPFALIPAIKFGLFFAFVLFVSKLFSVLWGSGGIYLASLISGLADVDAITISMATLAMKGDISAKTAVSAITIAVCSNTVVKGGIAYLFGAKKFGKIVAAVFGGLLILGLLMLLLV